MRRAGVGTVGRGRKAGHAPVDPRVQDQVAKDRKESPQDRIALAQSSASGPRSHKENMKTRCRFCAGFRQLAKFRHSSASQSIVLKRVEIGPQIASTWARICLERKRMLRIQRMASGETVFKLSGR